MHIKDSITKSLRKFIVNRRRAARRKAQRKARLVINISLAAGGQSSVPHEGYTRDLSEDGLAIIVPSLSVGGRYLTDADCTLRVVLLELPTGPVDIYAVPVRYEQLGGDGAETGHLIGLRITTMSDADRVRYIHFLGTLE